MPLSDPTLIAVEGSAAVDDQSCPFELAPQHQTVLSESKAQVCSPPAASAVARERLGRPTRGIGVSWELVAAGLPI